MRPECARSREEAAVAQAERVRVGRSRMNRRSESSGCETWFVFHFKSSDVFAHACPQRIFMKLVHVNHWAVFCRESGGGFLRFLEWLVMASYTTQ